MTLDWGQIITAAIAGLVTFGGSYLLFRGKRGENDVKGEEIEQTASQAFLSGQQTFQAYVDGVVEKRVEAAVAPFQQRLKELETRLTAVQEESHQMHDAVRARETQLWLWDQRGRPGQLPKLPDPILHRLGLGYLADDDWHTEPSTTT